MGITKHPTPTSLADAPVYEELRGLVFKTMGLADVFGALKSVTTTLGRKVNPTLYTPADMAKRAAKDNALVTHVLKQPKIWLMGTEKKFHARPA